MDYYLIGKQTAARDAARLSDAEVSKEIAAYLGACTAKVKADQEFHSGYMDQLTDILIERQAAAAEIPR